MWLDQDLLKLSEEQRRGAAAQTTTVSGPRRITATIGQAKPGEHPSLTAFQLSDKVACTEQGAQAHGYAKGFAAGWAAGQRRAAREAVQAHARAEEEARMAEESRAEAFADAMEGVRSLALAVQNRDDVVAEDMKSALADAAIELAEALLGAELADGPTRAKAALHRALSQTDPKEIIAVRMHPVDIAVLEGLEADTVARLDPPPSGLGVASTTGVPNHEGVLPQVKLVADPDLEPGDAIAQMPEGFLDVRLSSALERARGALARLREVGGEL